MVAQCVLFLIAGYDTTAITISYTVHNLARNPECQEKLLQEINNTLAANNVIGYDEVKPMKYLDAVVQESLRLFPPGVRIERRAEEDYELGDTGITVPKGMVVGVPVYALHRDPEQYPEPESFKPERFLPENRDSHHPFAHLPFGDGPRNCVAKRMALMEVKLALFHTIKNYKFSVSPRTKVNKYWRNISNK